MKKYRLEDNCCYCGDPYELQRDHVIAASYLRVYRSYEGDWLVTSCKECNCLLGDNLLFNVPDRASFVLGKMQTRYRKEIRCCITIADIEDAEGRMRDYLEACREKSFWIKDRLEHLRRVSRHASMVEVRTLQVDTRHTD